MSTSESVLQEAERLINSDRRQSYGDVRTSFAALASVWSSILSAPVTATQVALCMVALKLLREAHQHQRDNLVDIAGYAGLAAQLQGQGGEE